MSAMRRVEVRLIGIGALTVTDVCTILLLVGIDAVSNRARKEQTEKFEREDRL